MTKEKTNIQAGRPDEKQYIRHHSPKLSNSKTIKLRRRNDSIVCALWLLGHMLPTCFIKKFSFNEILSRYSDFRAS